jgi:dipeptidyl aminopeptidase/acylaminoacyl peptidase
VERFLAGLHGPDSDAIVDAADPDLSRDTSRLALTVTRVIATDQPPVTRVATVDLHDGAVSVREAPLGSDQYPRWSADGQVLGFLSDRSEAGNFQLYLAAVGEAAGEAIAMPAVDGIVESFAWSPTGAQILLIVAAFGADAAGCKGGATVARRVDSSSAWLPTIEDSGSEIHWRSLWVLDVVTRQLRPFARGELNIWEAAWLGDERIIAIVSTSPREGAWYEATVACVELGSGRTLQWHTPRHQIGSLSGSPDGRRYALIQAFCSDRLLVADQLMVGMAGGPAPAAMDTAGVDVSSVVWRNDHELVYAGIRGLETVVGEIDLGSGQRRELWSSETATCGAILPSALAHPRGAVVLAEGYDRPPEIALLTREAGYRRVVSLVAASAWTPQEGTLTPMAWTGRDGLPIQGLLLKPAGPPPWPVVVDIHGGPIWVFRAQWRARIPAAALLARQGVATLFPNPRGSQGRGRDFARQVQGDMGGEDMHDILRGVDHLVESHIANPAKLGVAGVSYGGFLSTWIPTQDSRFAAALPISGISDWFSYHRTTQIPQFSSFMLDGAPAAPHGEFYRRSPIFFADRVRTPILQLTGALDQNTPPTQALEFHRSLVECGARSVLVTYPAAAHGIKALPEAVDAIARYVGWFEAHLLGGVIQPE